MGVLDFFRRGRGKTFRLVVMSERGGWQPIESYSRKLSPSEVLEAVPGLTYGFQELGPKMEFKKFLWKEILVPGPPPAREPRESAVSPREGMRRWIENFSEDLKVVAGLGDALEALRGTGNPPADVSEYFRKRVEELKAVKDLVISDTGYGKLEFEGKAPWPAHPIVAKTIGDTIKDVTDHFADRFGVPRPAETPPVPPPEEELPELPQPEAYMPTPPPAPPTVTAPSPPEAPTQPPTEVKIPEEGPKVTSLVNVAPKTKQKKEKHALNSKKPER